MKKIFFILIALLVLSLSSCDAVLESVFPHFAPDWMGDSEWSDGDLFITVEFEDFGNPNFYNYDIIVRITYDSGVIPYQSEAYMWMDTGFNPNKGYAWFDFMPDNEVVDFEYYYDKNWNGYIDDGDGSAITVDTNVTLNDASVNNSQTVIHNDTL